VQAALDCAPQGTWALVAGARSAIQGLPSKLAPYLLFGKYHV
jgi:hypothetical protein